MPPNWLRDAFILDTACGNPSNIRGRHWFIAALGYFLGSTLAAPGWGQSSRLEQVTLSLPSGSVAFPLELAKRISADKAEGMALRLKFVNGGGIAISDLIAGNADFGVFGLPAAMVYTLKQSSLVAKLHPFCWPIPSRLSRLLSTYSKTPWTHWVAKLGTSASGSAA